MNFLNPLMDSLLSSAVVFAVAALGVWLTASKLTVYIDTIAERTGIGHAFAGLLFLGLATSLPEIATTVTASVAGQAQIAGSNLLGGVAMQVAILALVEMFAIKKLALTSIAPKSILLMQAVALIIMITLTISAIAVKEFNTSMSIGLWPIIFFLFYLGLLYIIHQYERSPRWKPTDDGEGKKKHGLKEIREREYQGISTANLIVRILVSALGVLVTGFLVTKSAEALVEHSGISGNLVGATLLALATSLPEVTTTWSAMRMGAYTMAISNILGTNSLEVALFLPADIAYREGPIINELQNNSIFLGALGILLTCVYLWGMLERRDRTFLGMGVDSAVVLLIYVGGMVVYSFM